MHVNLLKVPHHSSTKTILERISFSVSPRTIFVFSSNGRRRNPEREAFQDLLRRPWWRRVHRAHYLSVEDIDEGRRDDWKKQNKEENKKKKPTKTTARPNWSPKTHSLEALFADKRALEAKIGVVRLPDTPHVINLLDAVDF